jgi:hypothetical protein
VSIPEEVGNGVAQFVWAGGNFTPNQPGGMAEVAGLLRELVGVTREMHAMTRDLHIMTREMLENSRQQLELSKRWEQRTVEQIQVQRDDLTRLAKEHPQLQGRSKEVEEMLAGVIGKSMSDLYEYVDEQGSNLADSDYVRSELVDKYGGMLSHLHGMHGIVKRLSMFEAQLQREQQQQKPPAAG